MSTIFSTIMEFDCIYPSPPPKKKYLKSHTSLLGRIVFPQSRGTFTSNILVKSQYRLASSIKCPLLFTVWTSVLRHCWLHSSRSLVFPDLENEPDLLRLWIPFLKEIILTPPIKYYFIERPCFSSPEILFSFPFLTCPTLDHERFHNDFLRTSKADTGLF